jgi:hypothetical protein
MEKQILQNVPHDERVESLKATAVKTEKFTYQRELEQGEIQELQSELSQSCILIDQEDQKLKIHKETYKAIVKPEKQKIGKNLQMIRTGMEEVNGDVYLMKDLAEEKMGYYTPDGKLVFERRLKPEEMQYSIQDHLRKAE